MNTSTSVLWGGQGLGTNQTILSVMGEKKMTDGWEREWDAAKAEDLVVAQAPPAGHLLLTTPRMLAKSDTRVIPGEGG